MSHSDVLRRLIPLELGGKFDEDLSVEGAQLDAVSDDIESLRQTIITDIDTLLPPADNRFKMVPVKWDIKKPFYVQLAAQLGYQIRIDDYTTCMADWLCADDELIDDEPWVDMSAGVGEAGDTLSQEDAVLNWIWEVVVVSSPAVPPTPSLETVLNNLKPAHVQLNFTYL